MSKTEMAILAAAVLLTIISGAGAPQCPASGRAGGEQGAKAPGALAVYAQNPHYFADRAGKPILLIGDYTWGTFSDPDYDYKLMFNTLKEHGLNFARMWLWWGCDSFPEPINRPNLNPYVRSGPGIANDGRPKYDLTRFNPAFFQRLRQVCSAARERGIFLQLTIFDAWMIKHPHLWRLHACNRDNNINGVDGDPRGTGRGTDGEQGFCSLANTKVVAAQKAFIREVLEAVDEFDNILFEIANENYYNAEWERHLCEFIHQCEAAGPKRHLAMPLDLPNHDYGKIKTWNIERLHSSLLTASAAGQPLVFDSDGLGNPDDATVRRAAWTAFVSGGHVDYLDDSLQPGSEYHGDERGTRRAALRAQLGYLAGFARRTQFWRLQPSGQAVEHGRAYAFGSDTELVAYLPDGGSVTLAADTLGGAKAVRWFDPRTGRFVGAAAAALQTRSFSAPGEGDWVLYISR
jgi:hypothetical protein